MVKGERYYPATTRAGQYRLLITHSEGLLSADGDLIDKVEQFFAFWTNT